jgi:hypothetical protein
MIKRQLGGLLVALPHECGVPRRSGAAFMREEKPLMKFGLHLAHPGRFLRIDIFM